MALLTISPGPRNAHTDAETGLRWYRWRGVDYPSVTTIRRMAGLPFKLHQWTISQVVNRAVEQLDTMNAMMTRERRPRERHDPDIQYRKRVKETKAWLRAAAVEERDRKASRGTAIHDAATARKSLAEVPEDLRRSLHQFYHWLDDSGAEIIAVEQQVFNLSLGYAGTFDILCRMPDGRILLVDLKTGNSTYVDHVLQMIGYGMGEFVGADDVVNDELTKMLREANGMMLLHLTDEGWHEQEIEVTPRQFRAFTGLLDFAVFVNEFQDINDLLSSHREGGI